MKTGTTYIVKIGGNVVDNPALLSSFLTDLAAADARCVLVHGGGKLATDLSRKLGITTQMVDGRRITTPEMLDVTAMVYGGLINKKLVARLQSLGRNALGLTGADHGLIPARKRAVQAIDYGLVGDPIPQEVNTDFLESLLNERVIPVVAPLTFDSGGQLLNTNADSIASTLAIALSAYTEVELVYCFEKNGVLQNPSDNNSVISALTHADFVRLQTEGVITQGMIPKLQQAFDAIEQGVGRVIIGHASGISAILSDHQQAGTLITSGT